MQEASMLMFVSARAAEDNSVVSDNIFSWEI